MKPNGRRRWRKWAKKCRLKMNAHHRALYTGARMRKKQPVELVPLPPRPFSPRSLVGMSETSKRRLFRQAIDALPQEQRAANLVRLFRLYRIGERLRPCPNPWCSKEDGCVLRECHGSGVLPARGRG